MVKAVIFDFGNVLYDLDFKRFYNNFSVLLDQDLSQGFPPVLQNAMDQYEMGEISTETFIWNFQHFMKGNIDPLDIINAWNSLLDHFPDHRWKFLNEINVQYPTYLLSNINELHLGTVYKHLKKMHGKVDFETKYFNGVFYSHLIGHRKPDIDLYLYVEKGLSLTGKEILFIDDNIQNVNGALQRDWLAVHHNPENDIVQVFSDYLSKANEV